MRVFGQYWREGCCPPVHPDQGHPSFPVMQKKERDGRRMRSRVITPGSIGSGGDPAPLTCSNNRPRSCRPSSRSGSGQDSSGPNPTSHILLSCTAVLRDGGWVEPSCPACSGLCTSTSLLPCIPEQQGIRNPLGMGGVKVRERKRSFSHFPVHSYPHPSVRCKMTSYPFSFIAGDKHLNATSQKEIKTMKQKVSR